MKPVMIRIDPSRFADLVALRARRGPFLDAVGAVRRVLDGAADPPDLGPDDFGDAVVRGVDLAAAIGSTLGQARASWITADLLAASCLVWDEWAALSRSRSLADARDRENFALDRLTRWVRIADPAAASRAGGSSWLPPTVPVLDRHWQ